MRKFKELIKFVVEASRAGVAKYQAGLRDKRTVWVKDPGAAFGSRQSTYGKETAAAAAIETGLKRRDEVKAAAAAKGAAEGEAKAKAAAELAARIAATKQQATKGTGVAKQIQLLQAGQTIGVDLVDGGFGYIHHDADSGTKFFAKDNNQTAHPIHSVQFHPEHLKITTPKKSGKNVQFPVVGTIHHRDATPVKSGGIDRRTGRFTTQHDLNR
jgi:hypothetical protein